MNILCDAPARVLTDSDITVQESVLCNVNGRILIRLSEGQARDAIVTKPVITGRQVRAVMRGGTRSCSGVHQVRDCEYSPDDEVVRARDAIW